MQGLSVAELLLIPGLPLLASLVVGLFGWKLKEKASHTICIIAVVIAALLSAHVFWQVLHGARFYGDLWSWVISGGFRVAVGLDIDPLSALMMLTVTIVSACVHVYTIGYMHGDPGYTRFFSYISGFTFAMLVLVMGNNFLMLFFGWEAVGLVSYLLIGFWYERPSATYAALKAFIVNRVGDFGFAIGVLAVWFYFGTLDYQKVFQLAPAVAASGASLNWDALGLEVSAITFICITLFIGAIGKSGQVPLHVWLPDSMEGPTPISALIHAATMVTAGVFMVARLSPLFELSEAALATVTVVGAITAWMCATIGLVQNDIKRVIAYSTCSQLGYMFVACGVSAYSVGIFHLMTHAYFKALLFLAAGSVIHAMAAEQDIRIMGQLRRHMPITYATMFIAALALSGIPPFAGFWSKDVIIEAAHAAHHLGWAGTFGYLAVLTGVFMTAFYTFRMFFLVFHNSDRVPEKIKSHLHESPKVITVPLLILSIGALFAGWWGADVLHLTDGNLAENFLGASLVVRPEHNVLAHMEEHGAFGFLTGLPFWLAVGGIGLAWFMYFRETEYPKKLAAMFTPIYTFLLNKWYWDELYVAVFLRGAQRLGTLLWQGADVRLIDRGALHGVVIGSVQAMAARLRAMQTGYLYHYAFMMVAGVIALLTWLALGR